MVERYHIRSAVATVSMHQVYCPLLTGGKKSLTEKGGQVLNHLSKDREADPRVISSIGPLDFLSKDFTNRNSLREHSRKAMKASCESHWSSQHTPAVKKKTQMWPLRHYFPSMTPIRMAFLIKRRLAELWRNKKEKPFGWNVSDDFSGQVDLNMFVLRLSRATGLFT